MNIVIPLSIVILAAGKGKRMNNPDLPKVMVELDGKPLLEYVIGEAKQLQPRKIVAVVGHMKDKVISHFNKAFYTNLEFVEQAEQLGTGHAVMQAREQLQDFDGNTLILLGDVPLLRYETLKRFVDEHNNLKASLSVMSAIADDSTGYGRIIRSTNDVFMKITEHKDATEKEREIKEINSGIFCVDNKLLFESLDKISNSNSQGEYYLTDIVEIIHEQGMNVIATPSAGFEELQGINTEEDRKRAEKFYLEMIKGK